MDLGISGLASNFDWRGFIEQINEIERTPQRRLLNEQSKIEERSIAYGGLVTQLNVLKGRADALKEPSFFESRLSTVGDAGVAKATADTSAAFGSYQFDFTQLATTSSHRGTGNVGHRLNETSNVDTLELDAAAFATAITAGTFTVKNKQIKIEAGDSLGDVFTKINAATGDVTATYDETTDRIKLTNSGGPLVLGSASDTSNFLQVTRLYNNGTDTISSASPLGSIQQTKLLSQANFDTAITNGGAGAGSFKINGVSIEFDTTKDAVSDVLGRINSSAAGVTATYDSINDRFLLTNKTTGDLGIALEDVKGNFLAATGIGGGSLDRGKNLLYTVNNGATLTSLSNTVTAASSGIAGLTVTALSQSSTKIDVAANTESIKSAITSFIAEYNKMQASIDAETASSTDADGKVTVGTLASEREAIELAGKLRGLVNGAVAGLSGTIKRLSAVGIDSNGINDQIILKNSKSLDDALSNNLEEVKKLFTDPTGGIAGIVSKYADQVGGDNGSFVALQKKLNTQSDNIDTQVIDLERLVAANGERLKASFIAMETAQAKISQQASFLTQRFGSGS